MLKRNKKFIHLYQS